MVFGVEWFELVVMVFECDVFGVWMCGLVGNGLVDGLLESVGECG